MRVGYRGWRTLFSSGFSGSQRWTDGAQRGDVSRAVVRASQRCFTPTFVVTTAAVRCSPVNFARFFGDFRNAAVNAS